MTDSPEEEAALEADAKAYHADDLVKRLRRGEVSIKMPDGYVHLINEIAAKRIEELENALRFYAKNETKFMEPKFSLVARAALGEKKDG